MNQIVINDFSVKRGGFMLSPISLTIQKEEIFAILSHMGSGKTALLETVSGLFPGDTGSILFDGIDIRGIPPGQRKLGLVYQGYGLFPHMRVKENISYGLKMHRYSKKEQDSRARELMEMPFISHIRGQYPGTLGGGGSQHIALAGTLALVPQILLLDKPFPTLDPATRQSLHQELRRIHRRFDYTIIFVTHGFLEARILAGCAATPLGGRLETVTGTSKLINGHFFAEVEGFLGRSQIITAPERQKEKRIVQ